ncbi:hypothetical protein J6U78_04280 [bacterium]|nr:hypothetical protein [bacterium]
MKNIFYFVMSLIVTSLVFAANEAIKPDGDGTTESPYVLTRIENLVWMGDNMKDCKSSVFCLGNDIDASETAEWESPFVSIGWPKETYGQAYDFQGTLDGRNYAIKNLCSRNAYGLMRGLWGAEIKNLYLDNIKLGTASSGSRGGLAQNCHNSIVKNVHVSGQISGSGDCGGIFSQVYSSQINNCSFIGIIKGSGDSNLGGIASFVEFSNVTYCKTSGYINNDNGVASIGGICSLALGSPDFENYCIRYCIADMNIRAIGNVGGIVAQNYMDNVKRYPDGDVLYENCGLINNYSLCVSDKTSIATLGGICAICSTNSIDIDNFYDKKGISGTSFGTGLSLENLKRKSSFTNWDFDNIWAIKEWESTPYWKISDEKPYRIILISNFPETLSATPDKKNYAFNEHININVHIPEKGIFLGFKGGLEGTETNLSLNLTKDLTIIAEFAKYIDTADDFLKIGNDYTCPIDGYYIQTSDIDMAEKDNVALNYFGGVYNGNNHVIRNIKIGKSARYVGLFSTINSASVYNLGLINIEKKIGNQYFGFLGGYIINSEISNCYVKSDVYLKNTVGAGGIAGEFSRSKMIKCGFEGDVYVIGSFGGLAFLASQSSFEECSAEIYSVITIIKNTIGGLLHDGRKDFFKNCYAKGDYLDYAFFAPNEESECSFSNCYVFSEHDCVLPNGNFANCYFNSNCVEQVEGVTGFVSPEDMKKQETYVGWDFENVWDIDEGVGTPYFRYALPEPMGLFALLMLMFGIKRKQ